MLMSDATQAQLNARKTGKPNRISATIKAKKLLDNRSIDNVADLFRPDTRHHSELPLVPFSSIRRARRASPLPGGSTCRDYLMQNAKRAVCVWGGCPCV
eukprot:1157936-Pelagomonas_calceolata.AAC.11